jgi:magnesium chelatase family protein
VVRPGAVSLAHCGTLFLDEAPEFKPQVIDALRQPLESGSISIGRAETSGRFPARFQLVLAANGCRCGNYYGDGYHCTCSPTDRRRYAARISGPIRDRIDIVHTLQPLVRSIPHLDGADAEPSAVVRERVAEARDRQLKRYADVPWRRNVEAPGAVLRREWPLSADAAAVLDDPLAARYLTGRGGDRVLRLAWTVADLAGRDSPSPADVGRALWLRTDGLLGRPVKEAP